MRIQSSISWVLVVISTIISVLLWHDLRSERRELHAEQQLTADLRARLNEAAVAVKEEVQVQPAAAVSQPSTFAADPTDSSPAQKERAAAKAVAAAFIGEAAKRQKALMEDPEYRKARVAQARGTLQLRYPNLAADLGLSADEADKLLTLLAEGDVRKEAELASQLAGGVASDSDLLRQEVARVQGEQTLKLKSAILPLLGPERYSRFEEYQQTSASRQRIANLTSMLSGAGKPLNAAQSKSLTDLMIAEQRRQEAEARTQPAGQASSAERAIEGDHRILDAATAFLDAQQIELVKARFEQQAARQRTSGALQQRMTGGQ